MKIVAVTVRDAQLITGNVRMHIHAEKCGVELTFDTEGRGVWARGRDTNKLIPFSNINGLDAEESGREKPVTATK